MCQVTNQYGILVDQIDIHIYPEDFEKNGWYYENGYKVYYIDGEKQLDLDGILAPQSSYALQVNRQTGTVTILAQDGNNGYIIPVKRFACSVGVSSTPTPTGVFQTGIKNAGIPTLRASPDSTRPGLPAISGFYLLKVTGRPVLMWTPRNIILWEAPRLPEM